MEPNGDEEKNLRIEESVNLSMQIDPKRSRFPCCIVWTPLPVLSWFVPFIGHIGICREDGVILDFAGPNFVNVDCFTFGAPTRYIQLSKVQCCISHDPAAYYENEGKSGQEEDIVVSWDDALHKSTRVYQHRSYNILTCNCHSFVANCLNKLRFRARSWNVVNLAVFIFINGQWVSKGAIARTYLPFLIGFGIGVISGGVTFLTYLAIFIFVLIGWFFLGTYCFRKLIHI